MPKQKSIWKPMGFLLRQMAKHPFLMSVVVLTLVLTTATNIIIPYLTKPIINDYILTHDLSGLVRMLFILGIVYLISLLVSYFNSRLLVRLSQRVTLSLRSEVFAKLQKLPMSYFDKKTHGELMSTYTNDIDTISNFISGSVSSLAIGIPTFFGILAVMIVMNPLLTLVSGVFLFAQYMMMKKSGGISRKYFVKQQKDLANINGFIEEMTEGQKVIKVFGYENTAVERFNQRNDELLKSSYSAQLYSGIINPALGGIAEINNAITCSVGVVMAIFGTFDVGSLVAFILYVQKAGAQIGVLSGMVNMVLAAVAGTERVMFILDQKDEVDEGTVVQRETGNDLRWQGTQVDKPLRGEIRLEKVCFGYKDGQTVLKDISLVAGPGHKIAFVGSTGAGKTTITNLLNRFYEISSGRITYDDIDLCDIKKDDLRMTLSMVLQDTHLFTDTVRENIRFGRLEATDAEVENAAQLAGAHFFIEHLPNGYDTVLTADGNNLSQGQRQLLSIARAACANPSVLVLDEATSSIDTRTEKLIEEGMNRLMENRTVFIIAHRLSTVRRCDSILVLEHGEIIERGTHAELLEKQGRYHSLYTGKEELG